MIPILMITHNRLSYTMKAVKVLYSCPDVDLYIIDNGSTDRTVNWLRCCYYGVKVIFNRENMGIAYAMNQFLERTRNFPIVGKVDNDTIVPNDFVKKMRPHLSKADIVQAKHKLIEASKVGTFDEWVSKMPADGALRFNSFVGGSGILFRSDKVDLIPETDNKIMGWRQWQREHPEVKKAFATDVEVKLLDEDGYPEEYHDYYKQTGRL